MCVSQSHLPNHPRSDKVDLTVFQMHHGQLPTYTMVHAVLFASSDLAICPHLGNFYVSLQASIKHHLCEISRFIQGGGP